MNLVSRGRNPQTEVASRFHLNREPRHKDEIRASSFVVADLTDERPSCYFEAGYADALGIPVVFVASKESVVHPRSDTIIHFDIHKAVNFFVNHKQLREKLERTLERNWDKLTARGKAANKPMQADGPAGRR